MLDVYDSAIKSISTVALKSISVPGLIYLYRVYLGKIARRLVYRLQWNKVFRNRFSEAIYFPSAWPGTVASVICSRKIKRSEYISLHWCTRHGNLSTENQPVYLPSCWVQCSAPSIGPSPSPMQCSCNATRWHTCQTRSPRSPKGPPDFTYNIFPCPGWHSCHSNLPMENQPFYVPYS